MKNCLNNKKSSRDFYLNGCSLGKNTAGFLAFSPVLTRFQRECQYYTAIPS